MFADDTSLFYVVKNADASNIDLKNELKNIVEWAFQWRINFAPDRTKQAQELIFSRKVQLIDDTHREKQCFVQFSTKIAGWLLLTFLICLRNQLSSIIHSVTRIKSTDV